MKRARPPKRVHARRWTLLTAGSRRSSNTSRTAPSPSTASGPKPVMFADGFTPARRTDVYAGTATPDAAITSLKDTDAALTNAARAGQADAYRGHLADGARVHRPDMMPLVGQEAILAWLAAQPGYGSGGTYALKGGQGSRGFYVRAWTRGRDGVWRVSLDVLQPQV